LASSLIVASLPESEVEPDPELDEDSELDEVPELEPDPEPDEDPELDPESDRVPELEPDPELELASSSGEVGFPDWAQAETTPAPIRRSRAIRAARSICRGIVSTVARRRGPRKATPRLDRLATGRSRGPFLSL
jgi:hypothetical protein